MCVYATIKVTFQESNNFNIAYEYAVHAGEKGAARTQIKSA